MQKSTNDACISARLASSPDTTPHPLPRKKAAWRPCLRATAPTGSVDKAMPITNTEIGNVAMPGRGASRCPMMAAVAYTTVVLAPDRAWAIASRKTEGCRVMQGRSGRWMRVTPTQIGRCSVCLSHLWADYRAALAGMPRACRPRCVASSAPAR